MSFTVARPAVTLRAPVCGAHALQQRVAARPAFAASARKGAVRMNRTVVAALDPDNLDVMVAGGGGVGMEVVKRMKVRACAMPCVHLTHARGGPDNGWGARESRDWRRGESVS